MSKQAQELEQAIMEHFPDGVDVIIAPSMEVEEVIGPDPIEFDWRREKEIDPSQLVPIKKLKLYLTEIEPETGVYAAMSPITHRVYLYIDPSECGVG